MVHLPDPDPQAQAGPGFLRNLIEAWAAAPGEPGGPQPEETSCPILNPLIRAVRMLDEGACSPLEVLEEAERAVTSMERARSAPGAEDPARAAAWSRLGRALGDLIRRAAEDPPPSLSGGLPALIEASAEVARLGLQLPLGDEPHPIQGPWSACLLCGSEVVSTPSWACPRCGCALPEAPPAAPSALGSIPSEFVGVAAAAGLVASGALALETWSEGVNRFGDGIEGALEQARELAGQTRLVASADLNRAGQDLIDALNRAATLTRALGRWDGTERGFDPDWAGLLPELSRARLAGESFWGAALQLVS